MVQGRRTGTSPRDGYTGYINRIIKPTLGHIAINKLDPRDLESLYAELRRCRTRCDGEPFIEHKKDDDHDCVASDCAPTSADPWPPPPSARSTPSSAAS